MWSNVILDVSEVFWDVDYHLNQWTLSEADFPYNIGVKPPNQLKTCDSNKSLTSQGRGNSAAHAFGLELRHGLSSESQACSPTLLILDPGPP